MMREGMIKEKDLPLDRFEILTRDNGSQKVLIRIYEVTGVAEIPMEYMGEEGSTSTEGMTTYNEYIMYTNKQDNLEDYIRDNYEWFLNEAKTEHQKQIDQQGAFEAQKALDNSDYKVIKEAERYLISIGVVIEGREESDLLRLQISKFKTKYESFL